MPDCDSASTAPPLISGRPSRRFLSDNLVLYKQTIEAAESYVSKLLEGEVAWLYCKPFDPTPGNPQYFRLKNTGETLLNHRARQIGDITLALRHDQPDTPTFLECRERHVLPRSQVPDPWRRDYSESGVHVAPDGQLVRKLAAGPGVRRLLLVFEPRHPKLFDSLVRQSMTIKMSTWICQGSFIRNVFRRLAADTADQM
jgi:hypothetical protein